MVEPRGGTQRNAGIVFVEQVGHGGGSERFFDTLSRLVEFAMQWAESSAVGCDTYGTRVDPLNRIDSLDDIQDSNLGCGSGSFAASVASTLGNNEPGPHQRMQNLGHIVDRDFGVRRHVLCGTHRPVRARKQNNHGPKRVLGRLRNHRFHHYTTKRSEYPELSCVSGLCVRNPTGVDVCPVCRSPFQSVAVPARELGLEFDLQREFVLSRLPGSPSPEELKDLTDFMHGAPAPLQRCSRCGLTRRAEGDPEDAGSYEEDPNDPDVMAQVYPRYVQAFRNKEGGFLPLLRPNADVLELGPHLGGFLQTAEEWNWRPIGIDVGVDTTAFMRRNGLTVRHGLLEDARVKNGSADAVFIWNCFEQLLDPFETLKVAHRVLKKHGLLVVRVPNLAFYETFRRSGGFARRALAYNNLLGFPYLYGYTMKTLNRLLARAGFVYERGFNSELVTTPFADVSDRIAREQSRVSQAVAAWSSRTSWSTLTGPWIEAVYRRDTRAMPLPPAVGIDRRFMERAVA
jgi:hypothetical protein